MGNIRALFADANNNGVLTADEIIQFSDYYPFGREINYNLSLSLPPANNYKYNGKEFQNDLAEYDYGARFYDAVIGRWNVVDPMADVNRQWTPYDYAVNNPIRNIDPDGMEDLHFEGDEAKSFLKSYRDAAKEDGTNDDGGKEKGIIRPTSNLYRYRHPDLAIIHDIAYNIVDALGLNDIDDAIADAHDNDHESTSEKVSNVSIAVINVLLTGDEGERSGPNERLKLSESPVPNEGSVKRGAANDKVSAAIRNGKKEHLDLTAKAEAKGWQTNVRMIDPATGLFVIADVVTPSGHPLELKPNSPSGRAKGAGQLPRYERATGTNGRVIYYDLLKINGNITIK